MIQELLGDSGTAAGGRLLGSGERKIYAYPSPSPSNSSTTTTTTPTQNSSSENNQNPLRCPRCDSSNTKFCYYNNYNLTQPRHFCKTCRRYWTKGGALRNVPIGGGCRKNNKTSSVGVGHVIPSSLGKPSNGKLKTVLSSSEIGKSSGFLSGYDHELHSSNPNILWASPQSGHHLLALLRSTPNPNPNTVLNSVGVKEEGIFLGPHMMSSDHPAVAPAALNARAGALALDPSIGLCSNSFWRSSNQNHAEQHHQQQPNGNFILGEVQNTGGIPDHQLYHQRLSLRSSSSANYYSDHSPAVLAGNVMTCGSSSSNSSAIMESAPVAGGDQLAGHHNYWNINPSLSWSDLPTTNGAYP